jgi:hypothetical protein
VPSQPLAVGELNPCALERPPCEIARQRLPEAIAGVRGIRDERPSMTQTERDPCARAVADACLHLRHACARGLEPVDLARRLGKVRDQPG